LIPKEKSKVISPNEKNRIYRGKPHTYNLSVLTCPQIEKQTIKLPFNYKNIRPLILKKLSLPSAYAGFLGWLTL
jgi:hypothetical protein